jgi:hypothetical protein
VSHEGVHLACRAPKVQSSGWSSKTCDDDDNEDVVMQQNSYSVPNT